MIILFSDEYRPQKLKSDLFYENEDFFDWLQLLATNSNASADEPPVKGLFTGFFLYLSTVVIILSAVTLLILWRYYCRRVKTKQHLISRSKKKTVGGIKKSLMYMLKYNNRLQAVGGYNL